MEKYEFGRKDVLWCQIENWYPIFKRFCPKTEFFPLDKVILWLLELFADLILERAQLSEIKRQHRFTRRRARTSRPSARYLRSN